MEYELDYSEYYSDDLEDFGLCDLTHLKNFGHAFLPAVYSIVAALGILASVALLFILIRYANIRKSPPLCMATSDLLFAATLPFFAAYAGTGSWSFGSHGCKMLTFIYSATMYSSNFSLVFMTLEKYRSVVGGCCSVRVMRIPVRHFAVVCVWLLASLASLPHVYFADTHEYDGHQICTYHHVPDWRTAMKFEEMIVGFAAPFAVMCVCSVRLSCQVMTKFPDRKHAVLKQHMPWVAAFFILWCPYNVVILMHALLELHVFSDCVSSRNLHLAVQLTECLAFTHVFLNPLLYAFQNRRIRRWLRPHTTDTPEFLIESSEHSMGVELTAVHPTGSSAEGQ